MELKCGNCAKTVKRANATLVRMTWVGDVWVCIPCAVAYTEYQKSMMWEAE